MVQAGYMVRFKVGDIVESVSVVNSGKTLPGKITHIWGWYNVVTRIVDPTNKCTVYWFDLFEQGTCYLDELILSKDQKQQWFIW